jgi:hypothetical protein
MADFVALLISVCLSLSCVPFLQWLERRGERVPGTSSETSPGNSASHAFDGAPRGEVAQDDEAMLPEYNFSGGVPSTDAERDPRAANVVMLDPDVAERFPDSESVNRALRALAATDREHDPQRRVLPEEDECRVPSKP